MKTLTLFFFLTLLSVSLSMGQELTKISGRITNSNSEMVYLSTIVEEDGNRSRLMLDSSVVNEAGEFSLSAKLDKQVEATFDDQNENTSILLSPGDDLYMTLNTSFFDETIRYTGKGCEKNNAMVAIYLISEVNNNNLFRKMASATDTSGMFGSFDLAFDQYVELIEDYKKDIPDFKDKASEMLESAKEEKQQLRDYVVSNIAFSNYVNSLKGKDAINFEGVNLKGKKTSLSDYKGKMIIVDFWATWCGPCRAEFPAYKELEEKYGAEVNFVSVGLFCKEEGWKKMATSEGFANNIYLSKEQEKQIADYKVDFIPRYLVIDENFVIVDAHAARPSSGELEAFWQK